MCKDARATRSTSPSERSSPGTRAHPTKPVPAQKPGVSWRLRGQRRRVRAGSLSGRLRRRALDRAAGPHAQGAALAGAQTEAQAQERGRWRRWRRATVRAAHRLRTHMDRGATTAGRLRCTTWVHAHAVGMCHVHVMSCVLWVCVCRERVL
eukprot:scaffold31820_cov73-Phaeocystis_antarctica.AAC.2